MNDKSFFIIIGRSGCGKGTQSELLVKYFQGKYIENKQDLNIVHITTGGNFRDFIKNYNYTASNTRDILNTGGLMPEFLAIWNWANIFINNIKENDSVILDGAPRKMIEVEALQTALDFYKYKNPIVIYLDVSESWAKARLLNRGREDDKNEEEVNRKMKWFIDDVLPCIESYKKESKKENSFYKFLHIKGEKSVEEINQDIISKLENLNI